MKCDEPHKDCPCYLQGFKDATEIEAEQNVEKMTQYERLGLDEKETNEDIWNSFFPLPSWFLISHHRRFNSGLEIIEKLSIGCAREY